jgi:hypothetical protein
MAYLNEEDILECLFSLLDDEDDSEEYCGEDAADGLLALK